MQDQSLIAFDYDEHKNALAKLRDCFVENSVKITASEMHKTMKNISKCERTMDTELRALPNHEGLLKSIAEQKEELANAEKELSIAKHKKRDAQFNLKKIRQAYAERLDNDTASEFIARNDEEKAQKLLESMLREIYHEFKNLQGKKRLL
jgi:hypothetical protein